MIILLLHLFRLLPVLCGSQCHLALENLALRQQLAVYKKTRRRPKLHPSDRLFWVSLSRVWAEWRQALIIVTPDTVLRWHRRRFRDYWTKLSRRPQVGRLDQRRDHCPRPQDGCRQSAMGCASNSWRAAKLGVEVAERTVSRLIPKRSIPPSQTWRTFLTNHVRDLVSIDFFTVPNAQLRVLFVLVVLATIAAASSTSTSPSTPPPSGPPSRSWTLSPTTPPLPMSFAIATRFTETCSASG
jgi:putative transposase